MPVPYAVFLSFVYDNYPCIFSLMMENAVLLERFRWKYFVDCKKKCYFAVRLVSLNYFFIMKKFLVSMLVLLTSVSSFAQFSSGGFNLDEESIYWGVRFGITGASLSGDVDMGMKTGMTLSGVVGLRASDSTPVFLESGLYYTERGGKDGKRRVGYNNLEIPIIVKYGIKATDDIALLPFIGPYFSYAFSGKTKIEKKDGTIGSVGTFDEEEWTGLKRANMGFKLGCGAEYNKLYLEVGYQLGITNLSKKDALSARSNALFVNFGLNF